MRLTLRALILGLAPLLAISQGINAAAQSPPADQRFFQMALFSYYGQGLSETSWEDTVGFVDVPVFGSDSPSLQPPGRSIMRFENWWQDGWYSPDPLSFSVPADWSRILAVIIDEPYTEALKVEPYNVPEGEHDDNPCSNIDRLNDVSEIRTKLMRAVNAVHEIAPRARVWVNFHIAEVGWMRFGHLSSDNHYCVGPLLLNDAAIDVVSLDKYEVDFSDLQDEYDWFISAMPQQQIALVPGTHYRVGGDSPQQAADRLQGYFNYANDKNQQCDIGLGRVGRTGSYDGCRVWMVVGWLAEPVVSSHGTAYRGWLSSENYPIRNAWNSQLSKVRRRTLYGEELSVLLTLLQ